MVHGTTILLAAVALIHAEQLLLAPNLSAVAASFGMDSTEKDVKLGGGLAAALFLVGAPATLLVGMAADRSSRVNLLVVILILGAAGCLASGLASGYSQLFFARAVTGVSLGGALPLTFSLLGDMAGASRRTLLSGRIGLAMSIGNIGGQSLAGHTGPRFGWRLPFAILGLAMLSFSLYVYRTMREPPRSLLLLDDESKGHHHEPRHGRQQRHVRAWLSIFRVPSVLLILLQGIPGCLPHGVIMVFLPDYLHSDVGLSVPQATTVVNSFELGGLLGTFVGSELGQMLYNRRGPRAPAWLMLVSGTVGIVPMWLLIAYPPDASSPTALVACCVLAALGGFFAKQTGPNVRAVLTNTTRAEQRGFAFATFALCDDLGKGAGPAILSRSLLVYGRRQTFAAAMFGWLPCACLCAVTALTVVRDEARAGSTSTAVGTCSRHPDREPLRP